MRQIRLRWYYALAPLLALFVGYLTGQTSASRNAETTVPSSSLLLEYPTRWRAASLPDAFAALGLRGAVVLAPRGDATHGGLIAAAVREEGSLLPASLLAKLDGDIEGEAITLVDSAAFRYRQVSIGDSSIDLTAYAIPTGLGKYTFALCFAPKWSVPTLRACEQIVEGGQVPNQASDLPGELTPDASYAKEVGIALGTLGRARRAARAQMTGSPTAATLALAASRLSDAFAAAEAALGKLSAPPVASHAATQLQHELSQAKLAYAALADDATAGSRVDFALARASAAQAEAGVRFALQGFRLLGYSVA